MKRTISIIAVAAFLLLAGKLQAQNLGINLGYAPQTTTDFVVKDMNGFFAGVNYNHALSGNIGLSFGLQGRYNIKKEEGTFLSVKGTSTHTQILLDVPLLLNFAIPFGNNVRLAIFAGPMFSFALRGNTHTKGTESITGLSAEKDFNWYGEKSNYNQFDLMGAAGAALEFQQLRLFAGYRMGFLDLNKSDKAKATTSGYFVGLGYIL